MNKPSRLASLSPATLTAADAPLSYAQWVRKALAQSRDAFVLFDSSVDEPRDLLQAIIKKAFAAPVSDRYTSSFVKGNPFAVKALSRRYNVPEDHVLTTSAATTAISIVYHAYLAAGDHILVETPRFDLLATTAQAMNVEVEDFQRKAPGYAIDVDALRAHIRPNTKLIVLSDLHNPSGALLPESTMKALADLAAMHGVKVVIDEVYGDYADTARPHSAVHYSPHFIAINSLTKIYGLSTLRFGWVLASPDTLSPIRDTAGRFDFTSSNLSHAVAALVLEEDSQFDAYRREVMAETHPVMARAFENWVADGLVEGPMPDHGCILFPKLIGVCDTCHFSDWMAQTHNVRVAPGEYFGAPGHVRIGFAKDLTGMTAAFERFALGLHQYSATPACSL
ncbi:pyridoxal phosphate-dependent aminotransferase [Asticcacaulis sp. 201]|uniref:pyridoxal phosphate-dependent aminotransferase n=1 Tax=Asticcacaulis sp. 201 TaxID=3028787 RepID=UPI00291609E0|nr:pyridoxal phosphate-dependent aminotransferase [Asticcacaulis sp. 201]MDV6332943.1 pyridoxal phosphate-dependent aminotransferase [Asticcacaulis sp. 201]